MLKKLLILTGDASGDEHASRVIRQFQYHHADIEIQAVGGEEIKATGIHRIETHEYLGVVGLAALHSIYTHILLGKKIIQYIKTWQPDAVLLVDYGGFHLRLAKQLRQHFPKLKLFYYIPPQLWASREGRIKFIKNTIDHVFCIFPFEVDFYQKYQVPVTFVGHPILETIQPISDTPEVRSELGLDLGKPIIAILPGSRPSEISNLMSPLLSALPLINDQLPEPHQFVLVQAKSISDDLIQKHIDRNEHYIQQLDFKWVRGGHHHEVLGVANMALATSGTITLEAALYLTPMVITYKVAQLLLWIKPFVLKTKYFGLPNIILNKPLLPELLNHQLSAGNIATHFMQVYQNRALVTEEFKHIQKSLLGPLQQSQATASYNVMSSMLEQCP